MCRGTCACAHASKQLTRCPSNLPQPTQIQEHAMESPTSPPFGSQQIITIIPHHHNNTTQHNTTQHSRRYHYVSQCKVMWNMKSHHSTAMFVCCRVVVPVRRLCEECHPLCSQSYLHCLPTLQSQQPSTVTQTQRWDH